MGKVAAFRRRRNRWTRIDAYGQPPRKPKRKPPRRRSRLSLFVLRPFALAAALVGLWIGYDPALVEVPALLAGEPEPVTTSFTRCGPGQGGACVVDGDTIRLGTRRIRIVGIDTPEVKARCPKEARLAEAASVELLRLLNLGPFEMVTRLDEPTDRYGRELRALRRVGRMGTRCRSRLRCARAALRGGIWGGSGGGGVDAWRHAQFVLGQIPSGAIPLMVNELPLKAPQTGKFVNVGYDWI